LEYNISDDLDKPVFSRGRLVAPVQVRVRIIVSTQANWQLSG